MGNALGPVLLTGAAGYLGRNVLAALERMGLQIVPTSRDGSRGARCDLTDAAQVAAVLEKVAPAVVVHCAALVPKTPAEYEDPRIAEANLAMVRNVTATCAGRIVFVSSMAVYGTSSEAVAKEDTALQPPTAAYARSKWLAEELLRSRGRTGDVSLRLPGLFGGTRRSGLLYNAARSLLGSGTFELSSTAYPWAAMAVEDASHYVARAALVHGDDLPQAINVGYAGQFSIASAVTQIAGLCGVHWRAKPADTRTFAMDLSRLEQKYGLLGVSFADRLRELVAGVRRELAVEVADRAEH
jgi:nucleoside-diphosphate-sugar epimerase